MLDSLRVAAAAVAATLVGCGAGRSVYVVDQIEDGQAVMVDEGGELTGVRLADLPEGAQEGDVFVDGRADERERLRLLLEIRQRRARLSRVDDGIDLVLEGP